MSDLYEVASDRRNSNAAPNDVDHSPSPPDRAAFIHAICMALFIVGAMLLGWLTSPADSGNPRSISNDLSQQVETGGVPAATPR